MSKMLSRIETPCFVINSAIFDKNYLAFRSALDCWWPNSAIAYSVKTNALPWVLERIFKLGGMAEVVSDFEYELAKLAGFSDDQIVFNGPIKSKKYFIHGVNSSALVNIDSYRELRWLEEIPLGNEHVIGLRVNIDISDSCPGEFDYSNEGFRFGFSYENGQLGLALERIHKLGFESVGLHFHCNSITRSLNVYSSIANKIASIVNEYNLCLRYIDIGGGFFGGIPGKPSPDDYLSIISNELLKAIDPSKTTLILEPGSAIVGSSTEYVTTVLDVKDTLKARIVSTDGSRVSIDPLWRKERYMYSLITKKDNIFPSQIICGYTCMDHDRIMRLVDDKELSVGDVIAYKRVGAYSMTMDNMFIQGLPSVYVSDGMSVTKVRSASTSEDFYLLNSGTVTRLTIS
ncbi:MAG TPA: diaminopimelate decarboxylase [Clostridiaceae bacterium]|nr:diaminopimelate decarboxylase [Clostridiaceae bacterium]